MPFRSVLLTTLAMLPMLAGVTAVTATGAEHPTMEEAWRAELQFLEWRQSRDALDYHAPVALGYAYMKRARILGDASLFEVAEGRFKASKAIEKNNPEASLGLAQVYSAQHRFKDAIALTDKLLVGEPDDPSTLAVKGDALLNMGATDDAEKVYLHLKTLEPGFYYLSRDANLRYMKGDVQGAIDTLTNGISDAPASMPVDIAWCNVQIGQLYFMSGKLDRAEQFYNEGVKALPGYIPALDHLAELYAAREEYDKAAELYKDLLERVPRPDLQQALGDMYLYRGMKDEAKKWHDLALAGYTKSSSTSDMYAHNLAGFFCDCEENPAEALKWAKKDMELRQSCYAYDTLAWALYKNGDYAGAATAMTQALAGGIKEAHLYFHAGLIFAHAGNFAQGKSCAQEALTINPMFPKFHVHR